MTFGDSTTFETFVLREAATHRTFEFELALANPFKKYIYVRSIEEQLCTDMDTDSASENDRVEETENQVNGEETQDSEMTMTQDDDAHNNQGNGVRSWLTTMCCFTPSFFFNSESTSCCLISLL